MSRYVTLKNNILILACLLILLISQNSWARDSFAKVSFLKGSVEFAKTKNGVFKAAKVGQVLKNGFYVKTNKASLV